MASSAFSPPADRPGAGRRRPRTTRGVRPLVLLMSAALPLSAGCTDRPAPAPGRPAPQTRATAPSPGGTASHPGGTAAAGTAGPDGRPGCAPPSPVGTVPPLRGTGPGSPEVRGTGHGARLWGLVQVPFRSPLIRAGDDVKIVWRMTGTGGLRLSAIGPDGRARPLAWGPEAHGGSSYRRPGDEWGAGYRFDRAGCWNLHAARGTATADVWIKVAAR